MARRRKSSKPSTPEDIADSLHSAAIHLLRRLRQQDLATGLSAARLSALSVIVFGGPLTISDLANAEQVKLPTVSRLVADLALRGLITRRRGESDLRQVTVQATPEGKRLLSEGRRRRVADLQERLSHLSEDELQTLSRAATLIEAVAQSTLD